MQQELQKLNDTMCQAGLPFHYNVIAVEDGKYIVRVQDTDGHVKDSHPYSEQGTLRYLRMMTIHWGNA